MTYIDKMCPLCDCSVVVKVRKIDRDRYYVGVPVQDAFPYLDKVQKETIISGLCAKCQKLVFQD